MRDLLRRLGYEYKKPKLVHGNPDIDAQYDNVAADCYLNSPRVHAIELQGEKLI